jgi:sulfur-oxidizing protein SoxY
MSSTRRECLVLAAALAVPSAHATPEAMAQAIAAFTGGARIRDGRVRLEVAELVENGNTVPLTVSVEGPLTGADQVIAIGLFTERNPQPDVAVFHLGPRAGRAAVTTRIRLATSQAVTALARLADGSVWRAQAAVVVTLAACVEGG